MKKILLFCLSISSFVVLQAQSFEWKRLSYDITDTSYYSSKTTTDIVKNSSNYYFAFYGGPAEENNWPQPNTWAPGFLYPTVLSDNNQLLMIDTISLDSVEIFYYHYKTFVQNDTFRVLVNYPYLDSADFQNHSMFRKGLPVPKCNGFLIINYTLAGDFVGYDSLPLPTSLEAKANVNRLNDPKALNVVNLYVDDNNEMFLYLGYWKRGTGSTGHVQPLDTLGYIVKYHSDMTPDNKVVPVMLRSDNSGYDYKVKMKMHNNELYLLGQINDTSIVDNLFFTPDSANGLNTFAVKFNTDLFVTKSDKLPGDFVDFTIDDNGSIYTLSSYHYRILVGSNIILPDSIYIVSLDTVVSSLNGLIHKLDGNLFSENYSRFSVPGINNTKLYSNGERVFALNLFSGFDTSYGSFYSSSGDSMASPVHKEYSENVVLINSASLMPSWQYNFPVDNTIKGLYFFDDKMLISYNSPYYFLAGFGDQDTLFHSGDYDPVAIAQIGILGLGLEEMTGSEAAPLKAYPNPVQDNLFVELPENNDFYVSVFDLNGKLVLGKQLTNGEKSLNVTMLHSGLYIVRAQNEKQILTGKFLKE